MNFFENIREGNIPTDEVFDLIYPNTLKETIEFHFTPIEVVLMAARFLSTTPDSSVMDIGSGAGKFCLIAASAYPARYTGIEIRSNMVALANQIKSDYFIPEFSTAHFIQSNIVEVDFKPYQSFYHFNAFYEHKDPSGIIDTSIALDKTLYKKYSEYVKSQLAKKPKGTKLATYFSYGDEVPENYKIVEKAIDGKLLLWVKKE